MSAGADGNSIRKRVLLTARNVAALRAKRLPYRVWDAEIHALFVRVQPSGIKSYNVRWSRRSSLSVGKHPQWTPDAARVEAHKILAQAKEGGIPDRAKKKPKIYTLRELIDDADHGYAEWAKQNRKSGERGAKRIKSVFADLLDKPLTELHQFAIEKWRSQRLKAGKAAATVNRDLAALKAAISKAVEWEFLEQDPIKAVKLRRVDNARIRYLKDGEERRLREALAKRDREAALARRRANAWRGQRGYDKLPDRALNSYCDHLTPLVLVAMNTGLRRGELLGLKWDDVKVDERTIHVRAAAAKGGRSRHVPLNAEALDTIKKWRKQGPGIGTVFPVRNVKTAWNALVKATKIADFHFHDLRHNFASRLVMAKVDLNTVRELLGHQDLKMTLRYAHLSHGHKEEAVELLARKGN